MDEDTARERLRKERADVSRLLQDSESVGRQDRLGENEPSSADDRAQPLTAEGVDDAIVAGLRHRLAARSTALNDDSTTDRSVAQFAAECQFPTSGLLPTRLLNSPSRKRTSHDRERV